MHLKFDLHEYHVSKLVPHGPHTRSVDVEHRKAYGRTELKIELESLDGIDEEEQQKKERRIIRWV
jgi:hypothetical protein